MSKALKTPQSGKRGNTVSFKSRYGQVEREKVVPANPNTNAQVRTRGALSRSASRWRLLTDEQRAAWINCAREVNSQPRLGQSGHLTGCQLYIKVNCIRAAIGEDSTDTPPDRPTFAANPVGALTITNDGGDTALKLSVSRAPAHYTLVLGTVFCSAGRAVPRRFVILGCLPNPVSGVSDITDLYTARFGVPPAHSRIFIRTLQVAEGWEDLPNDTTAIVPAK